MIIGFAMFLLSNTGAGWIIPIMFSIPAAYCFFAVYYREYVRRPTKVGIDDSGLRLHYHENRTVTVPWDQIMRVHIPTRKDERDDRMSGLLFVSKKKRVILVTMEIARTIKCECERRGMGA